MTQYDADMMAATRDTVWQTFPYITVRNPVHGIKSQITQHFRRAAGAIAEILRARFG
jgi:hypothetical protein